MRRPSKSRVIVGGVIHGGVINLSDIVNLKGCAISFMGAAWGNYTLPKKMQISILVEGEPRESVERESFRIDWHTLDITELMIDSIEKPQGNRDKGTQVPNESHIILSIGSKEFCQAWTHFWATSQKHASPWGLHMLRKFTGMQIGEVAWYDTQDNSIHHGDIGDMYLSMQKAAQGEA
jgi:hypothetical protein